MANGPQFYGTIPNIQQAYVNDPRTKLAASMLANGTSTAPVAQGGWAVTDGLARAAQAVAGAIIDKKQQHKYAQREYEYQHGKDNPDGTHTPGLADVVNAAAGGTGAATGTPPPAPVAPAPQSQPVPQPPAVDQAATALAGPPQGPQNAPQTPTGPIGGLPSGLVPPGAETGAGGPPSPSMAALPFGGGGTGPNSGAPRFQVASLFREGILPTEGGTDPRTGAFRTSPKGAVGPGQIMPKTAPEAARLADSGFHTAVGDCRRAE